MRGQVNARHMRGPARATPPPSVYVYVLLHRSGFYFWIYGLYIHEDVQYDLQKAGRVRYAIE